jgi:PKD repeat protein
MSAPALVKGVKCIIKPVVLAGLLFCSNLSYGQGVSASFNVAGNSGCIPFTVQFNNTSTGAQSYYWDFGNGNFSTSANPVNVYLNPGSYSVKLVAYGPGNTVDSVIFPNYINTVNPPAIGFTANITTACEDINVITFTNQSQSFDSCVWDFGDGVTSSVINPVHTYTQPGIYTVTLICYNTQYGCSGSLSKQSYINILGSSAALFTVNQTVTCNSNFVFQFQGSSSASWNWNFGDGSTSSLQNPSHSYTQPGIYSVSLITTNQLGCTDTLISPNLIEVKSNPQPAIVSITSPDSCAQVYVAYTSPTPGISNYLWDFGDTTVSYSPTGTHTYFWPGNYNVSLTVQYSNGCSNTSSTNVVVHPIPIALFTITNPQGCAPHNPILTNYSTGTISSYLWNFGDGTTSNSPNPTHTYSSPGTYNLSLQVSNNFGCSTIYAPATPVVVVNLDAQFNADDLSGCAPHTVNFTYNGSAQYSYNWDFGDGNTSTQMSPSHTYLTNGTYTVSLTVNDNQGCISSYTLPNQVQVTTGVNNFSPAPPVTACAPFTVNLNDNSPSTNAWLWDFGDGSTSTNQNPTHTYNVPGTYIVSLATQSSGNSCSQSVSPYATYIILGGIADFEVTQTVCPPYTATFTDQSTNAVSWLWDFGDGTTSTQQHPVHVYSQPGNYNVTLTITTADGCTYTEVHNYAVSFLPLVANVTATTVDSILPMTVNFSSNSSGATSWLWSFGDGDSSTQQNPVHIYTTPGPYNISLTISNAGCTYTYNFAGVTIGVGTIQPGGPPDSLHVPDPVYNCIPYEMSFSNPAINTVAWFWDFGDGDTSWIENPTHIYTTPGVFTVTLITWDAAGQTDTIVQPSSIYLTGSKADFTLNYSNNCQGSSIIVNNNSINASTYLWDFGDGSTSVLQSPTHVYNTTGINYIVSLFVTDTSGCSDFMSRSYYAAVNSTINASTRRSCANDTVFFNSGYLNFAGYSWDFGDGTTSSLPNPFHVYSDSGSFQVVLTVTDTAGCTNSFNLPYLINISKPVADFTFTATSNSCNGLTVDFTNLSTGADSWSWDFGDGDFTILQNPSHNYPGSAPGSYYITLTAQINGCSNSFTSPVSVFIPNLQVAFNYNALSDCYPITVVYTDSSTDAVSWLWQFGDGTTSTLQNPVHTFNSQPSGSVFLTVTDVYGCAKWTSRPNIEGMVVNFGYSDSSGCAPYSFQITDSSENVSGWLWDFGDGTTSVLPSASHIYSNPGVYNVSLTATSASGCTQVFNPVTQVIVTGPVAQFNTSTVASCAPTIVNFNDASNGATFWQWNFGDGNQSSIQDPVHIYNQPGIYDVTLIISDSIGCTDTLVSPGLVHITGSVANFAVSSTSGCSPWEVSFQDSSISAFTWIWNFGDGNISYQQNPVHIYNTPGNYVVTLMTQDTTGCQSVYSSPFALNVQLPPVSSFSFSDSAGCTPFSVQFTNSSTGGGNYLWDFGDGTISTDSVPSHVYTTPGNYYVSLINSTTGGCHDTTIASVPISVGNVPSPSFTVLNNTGCPPLNVQFNNTSTNVDSTTVYEWNLGNGIVSSMQEPFNTYFQPGIYNITLTATNNGACSQSITMNSLINVLDGTPLPPVELKSASVINNTSVELTWENLPALNLAAYKIYRYNRATSAYDLIYTENNPSNTSWNNTSAYTDTSLNTTAFSYTYIVQAVNECGNEPDLNLHIPHTTINVSSAIDNNVVEVTWTPYSGCSVGAYEIYRQDYLAGSFNLIATVDDNTFGFYDSTVYCGMISAYRIKATGLCGEGFEAFSDTTVIEAPGILLNQTVDILRSTVNDDSYVFVEWVPPVIAPQLVTNYELKRSTDNINFFHVATLNATDLSYSDYDTDVHHQNYYYRIVVNNICNLQTMPGLEGSSILLQGSVDQENRSNLRWTKYELWDEGVDYYVIEKLDINGNWNPIQVVNGDVLDYIDR